MINRAVLIVRPGPPFLEWAAQLDDSGVLPDPAGEQTVYLIPCFEDDDEAQDILARIYPTIFENELHGWHTDDDAWPADRTLAMFKSWFTIELHSVVEDLCADEIIDDDEEDEQEHRRM